MTEKQQNLKKKEPEEKAEKAEKVEEPILTGVETETTEIKKMIPLTESDVIEEVAEEEIVTKHETPTSIDAWKPKTALGKKVASGEIRDIKRVFASGQKLLETEIVDALVPNMESELLLIGQSKGKFGGGQRRVFKQTQKKTKEGNKPKFSTCAAVGNKDGVIGIGFGKAKETVPAREKAFRRAKFNVFMIRRGCGSWECNCQQPHSIPFAVEGKCGSIRVTLLPAPKGKGLVIEKECQKLLHLAGIKDVWSKIFGKTTTKTNLIMACVDALRKLTQTKIGAEDPTKYGIITKRRSLCILSQVLARIILHNRRRLDYFSRIEG